MQKTLVSMAEFAERHGVLKTAVAKWKQRKLLVVRKGKIDPAASDVRLQEASLGRFAAKPLSADATVNRLTGAPYTVNRLTPPLDTGDRLTVLPTETPDEAAERILGQLGARLSLLEATRLKENYLALLRQLEYDQKSGQVVAVADVARAVGQEYARCRSRLLAIPAEQAPRLHACRSPAEVRDMLLSLITAALEELTADGAAASAQAAAA